jgi:23S rRNA (adenine2030-N6)-methyltransferase
MLSYQHGYHAGSFADVHKHTALCLLLDHLLKKPAAFCFVDSHAGRGPYDLTDAQAQRTGEWQGGIGRLVGTGASRAKSAGLRRYLDIVSGFNSDGGLRHYPGSPSIACSMMRKIDRLDFIEPHPAEHLALRAAFRHDKRVHVHKRDAFELLPSLIPPIVRRGMVLIDPSYEVKTDYQTVPKLVETAVGRWPSGIFAIWYPILPDDRHLPLVALLNALARPLLIAELTGPTPERGLVGTGLAVINPPWQFDKALSSAGEELAACLFGDAGRHRISLSHPAG